MTANGDILHEDDLEYFMNLLEKDYNRKVFFDLFSKYRIKSNYRNPEYQNTIRDIVIRFLTRYLTEVFYPLFSLIISL